MDFLKDAEVTLWMMSCGALVNNKESFSDLATAANR
jgi:hypothetical protein